MEQSKYHLIVTIVGRGRGARVAEASHIAGTHEETIIYGNGAAVHLLLGINIEPEREIVLALAEEDKVEQVLSAIVYEADLDEPNKGVVFSLPLDKFAGVIRT